jgi:electron transfer flavoprotein alpha subunit
MGNVLIVAEQKDGKLRTASLNAFTFGKKMVAATGGDLVYLVLGDTIGDAANEAAKYGAKKVIAVNDPGLQHYMAETYAPVVVAVAKSVGASVVGATATATGKDLMPRVAALLGAGMASDVIAVAGPKSFKRPMVAGNAIATVEVQTPTVVVTARQTEFAAATAGGVAPVEQASAGALSPLGAKVVKIEEVKSTRPDLSEAKVVVSGGRGMKSAENFKNLETLTDLLGGALGATRAACDAGMVPNDLQVGQTGRVVAPDLYVAVGISGALQHLAGMKSSRVIVAINKDPEAPIFQVADYGLVAKWEDTVPTLIDKVRAIRAAK